MGTTDTLRFVFEGAVRELRNVDPNRTVLDWLRTEALRTGTKEGCAEGDCGACTVVLGEAVDGQIRYRAVNACILFLPVLDGKQLIVVEDLQAPGRALHPVQQAMVDHHGSQCGFCTPGFVMSLFALYKSEKSPDRQRINDVIAGNLCRCTGYRPIVDAAVAMYGYGAEDHFSEDEAETLRLLESLRRKKTLELEGAGRRYYAPVTSDSLAELLQLNPDACLLAGGTDVGLWVTKNHRDLDTVIYVGGVRDLHFVRSTASHIEIGSAVSYTDAMDVIAQAYPDFGELFRRLGSVQIRNAGTIGGNIANASPIGDSMPGLIALGTTIQLRKGKTVRTLPLEDYFLAYQKTALDPGEFVLAIEIPLPRAERHFHTYKISKRFDQDISAVCGAYCVELQGRRIANARVCYGGMAATPKRAEQCEAALVDSELTESAISAAAQALERDYSPLTDMRASAAYRMAVAKNLLHRMYFETSGTAGPLHVLGLHG